MRVKVMLVAALLGVMPGVAAAQTAASPPGAEAAPPAAEPTCADLRAAARRDHDEAERARIAAHDDGVRYAFFFDCPLAEDEPDWGIASVLAEQQAAEPASWNLPATTTTGSGTAMVTRRTTPARAETPEEFYNRSRPAPTFDEAVASRQPGYSQESIRTVREAELGNGRVRNETRQSCTQTAFERTCSSGGTVTFSSGDDEASRELLEGLLRDD